MLEGGAISPPSRSPGPAAAGAAVPAARRGRPPLSVSSARPGPAGSARPHRLRRSARSACAATAGAPPPDRVAAALGAPLTSPARGSPVVPAACSAYPRAATNLATACDTQLQGPEAASHTVHTPTGSHTPALPHTRGSHTASQGPSTSTRHIVAPYGVTQVEYSKYVTQSQACTRSRGETVPPATPHTVKHSNRVTTIHAESYIEHACATHCSYTFMGTQKCHSHIIIMPHHHTYHTPLHTRVYASLESGHLACITTLQSCQVTIISTITEKSL